MKHKRRNKTGITLLTILLTTSLVAVVSLGTAVAGCVKVHKLEEQVAELREELHRIPKTEPVATEPTVTEPVETEPVVTEPTEAPTVPETEPTKNTEPEPVLTSLGEFRLTAYCHCEKCCGVWAENRPNGIVYTASGTVAEEGRTIAVDPKVIPYGTVVVINGNEYIAEDCGGSIKQNRIDVYFESHQEALVFGVQYAEVFVLEGSETSGNDLC